MRSLLLPLLAAALPLACASAPRPVASGRRPPRFVRVAEGTTLRARPADDAPGVTVPTGATLRRVRARDGWIELETLTPSSRQCAPVLAPPRGLRLRFFARASAVGPVLAAPLSLTGPQGALEVQPGVALRDGALHHAGLRLTLPTAPASATEHLAPHVDRPAERAERRGTRAALPDGVTVEVDRDPPVYVLSRRATGDGARVVVATPCVRFEAVVADGAVLPALELDVDPRGEERAPTRWVLRRGARLRWSDGSPAGRATGTARITDGGREVAGARCFRVPLRVEGASEAAAPVEAEVCADAGDVAEAR